MSTTNYIETLVLLVLSTGRLPKLEFKPIPQDLVVIVNKLYLFSNQTCVHEAKKPFSSHVCFECVKQ